jgi:hypothetical protein
MKFIRGCGAAAIITLACILQMSVFAGTASAASTSPFGCRASVARVNLLTLPSIEPLVANKPLAPCVTDATGATRINVPSTGTPFLTVGAAGAFTASSTQQPTTAGPITPGAIAFNSVDGVVIPTSSGDIAIVGPAEAIAGYTCTTGGQLISNGYSTLDLIYLNGKAISLGEPNQQHVLTLGPITITVNEKIQTANSLTERILDVHIPNLADIIVGESHVTITQSDPCAGVTGTSGAVPSSSTLKPCPKGSTFDPATDLCVIVLPGGKTIVVSNPFQGPTGGTVLSLALARKRYHSPCLSGPGPQYVVVGTNHADRINGTSKSERILALGGNDRVAGGGGNDCIDGGSGNDRIWAGKGNVRLYGGTGNDRLSQQGGNAYVNGGPGNDQIFLGNGRDTVYGGGGRDRIAVGRGNDRIYGSRGGHNQISGGDGNDWVHAYGSHNTIWLGNGLDHVWAGVGNNRVYDQSVTAFVNCGTGTSNLAYLLVFSQHYARAHGCQTVKTITPKRH